MHRHSPAAALLIVLALAGCTATPEPEAAPSAPAVIMAAKPDKDPRPPAEACSADGVESAGLWVEAGGAWFEAGTVGEGDTVAILVPQARSNYCGWMAYSAELSAAGIQSLLINPCDQGLTACELGHGIATAAEAVLAAATVARESGASRVVAVGASMGGMIALRSAELCADDCPIDGAASLAGPLEFGGVDTLADAGLIEVPLFLAVAPGDSVITADQQAQIAAAAQGESTSFAEGTGHGWTQLFAGQAELTPVGIGLRDFILG